MIEHKEKLFKYGIGIFAHSVCQRDQRAYIEVMVHEGGYVKAAKHFFTQSGGYLKKEEADRLYEDGVVPEWMVKVFMEVEQDFFGQTLWDKQ